MSILTDMAHVIIIRPGQSLADTLGRRGRGFRITRRFEQIIRRGRDAISTRTPIRRQVVVGKLTPGDLRKAGLVLQTSVVRFQSLDGSDEVLVPEADVLLLGAEIVPEFREIETLDLRRDAFGFGPVGHPDFGVDDVVAVGNSKDVDGCG